MNSNPPIQYWNRQRQRTETEKVYGDRWLRWTYESALGTFLENTFLSKKWVSNAYGKIQSLASSSKKIPEFVRNYEIQMDEYESGPFHSFNDFFIRRFKPDARNFIADPGTLSAPAEARYLGFQAIHPEQKFPVKGTFLTAEGILGSKEVAEPFQGGPLLIARLCPVDYHRYHYPDSGRTLQAFHIHGRYHSVNPAAFQSRPDLFIRNERRVSILETKNFGLLAYVEVGALCVGRIVQSFDESQPFRRGDEKGYFLFGGSTVILLGQPGKLRIAEDILEHSAKKTEVLVRLGESIASKH